MIVDTSVYPIDIDPEIGVVPDKMYAYVIRPERHGHPHESLKQEVVDVPVLKDDEVLIKVKAAGVNHNGLWAALGKPLSPSVYHGKDFHIAGSDASGIIWKIGKSVKENKAFKYKVGDEVIIHCSQTCGICPECNGGDPMLCDKQQIWGYETPYGSFAQYTTVQPQQILKKPEHLSWEDSGSYLLTYSTVWKMLFGFPPNDLKPGQNVLIWGASGGLGDFAIKLVKLFGGNPLAVVSSEEKGEHCVKNGAIGYINRTKFSCWGTLPEVGTEVHKNYMKEAKKFGAEIWKHFGEKISPDIIIEHIGESTFPVSCFTLKKGGMVVFCGASSGFNLSFDAAHVWMRTKRIQGSHFCDTFQIGRANQLVLDQKIHPKASKIYNWEDLPQAHADVLENKTPLGNIVIKVN